MKRNHVLLVLFCALATLVIGLPNAVAYERYRDADSSNDCVTCHGDFDSSTSPKGSVFPRDDKHTMHNSPSYMNTECSLCHTTGDSFNPFIGSSDGTDDNVGYGCVGCHGRFEDSGNDGISDGLGAGLRQHHYNGGITTCVNCHSDSNPGNYTPVGEDVKPSYYGTPDTNVDMPCNAVAASNVNENWTVGDFVGLDNDGDEVYDGADTDCQELIEEDCFDGIDNDSDGLTDCEDPDCDGAEDGACDTGEPGICSAGTRTCVEGGEVCIPDTVAVTEGPFGDPTCEDALDNDCDGLTDTEDPDCQELIEEDCFDGIDNDSDGLTDCEDPDCDGAEDGVCDTGEPGICSAGTRTCVEGGEVCIPDTVAVTEGPFGDPTCEDALDNDCDGLTDTEDPNCQELIEEDCFDGIDNDSDGLTDCEDPDCEGAVDGACDTGEPGICAAGTRACVEGGEVCMPDAEAVNEGPFGDPTCEDALDNDCDGLTDTEDPDCQELIEEDCFDGIDNDSDGLTDCEDPNCDGAEDGACDTGEPGICSAGTRTCVEGGEVCVPDTGAVTEGPFGDPTCEDALDNDCDGLTDTEDPDCQELIEEDCFDGIDNDSDGLTDCEDPDCEGAVDGACDTGEPGICAAGTRTCVEGGEVCMPDAEAVNEGPFGDPTCEDALDNDCDGLTDTEDPDCQELIEEDCFDGIDNDSDGLTDCEDPDCEGAVDGACDTGEPGICAAGTRACVEGGEVCMPDAEAVNEGPFGDPTCEDALDNDCDGLTDTEDPDCQELIEEDCFDGIDNDSDGLTDCEDPDCDGAIDGACDTGEPGICSAGTRTCVEGGEVCMPDAEAVNEGPFGDPTCEDALDNDCDGLTDTEDPDCQELIEEDCFDGIDNDSDGLTDCEDPNCDGAEDGACDTGEPGICSAGTRTCVEGGEVCVPDTGAVTEGPFGDPTCEDALDNDCDGLTDTEDPDCQELIEEDCFDGIDNDSDGLTDCEDPDCDGAIDGACDSGEPGNCSAGTLTCVDRADVCVPDSEPQTEGPPGDATCEDSLDNDCDGLTDGDDPGCQELIEEDCFDGIDNDSDGLTDCADPDCDGAIDGACDSGEPGICADGTYVCADGEMACVPDTDPVPEGNDYFNCDDGLDNDCDGLTDYDDPDCTLPGETDCFDGIDNDSDGLTDCEDPDCEGALDGPCDTEEPGVCSAGTYMCKDGAQICWQDEPAQPEGNMYDNCEDGLDNDCDGLTDYDDPDCSEMEADVWLKKLIAHKKINLQDGDSKRRRVFVQARADTKPQEATVTLMADYDPAGVSISIRRPSITQTLSPTDEQDSMFKFWPVVTCEAEGAHTVMWTAEIDAPENRETAGDVLHATSVVNCREATGNSPPRPGHGNGNAAKAKKSRD